MSTGAEKARRERRPDATSFQVDDLLARVRAGQLRLPHFQRPQTWVARDRLDLFDSLYRCFPIGTLLLWKSSAPAGRVVLGDYSVEANARADALSVVLESHGIPPEARDALASGNTEAFPTERASHLRRVVGDFFEREAEYGADDSHALVLEDET